MSIMTSAGSTLGIATGVPATYDAAGFGALTYVTVGEVTDLGQNGREYVAVNHSPVGSRRTVKLKGSYHSGAMQIKMARDTTNLGQIAMKAALLSDSDFSFKITLQDLTKVFFTGKVSVYKLAVGTVDQVTAQDATIEIISDIIEV